MFLNTCKYLLLIVIFAVSAHAKTVLTSSDLTVDGVFKVPTTSIYKQGTLTIKRISGTPYLFTLGGGLFGDAGKLKRIAIPGTLGSGSDYSSYPEATIVDYGLIYGDKNPYNDINDELKRPTGLYWDETDGRMYWLYSPYYENYPDTILSIGYSTINDTTHTGSGVGMWKMSYTGKASGTYAYGDRWLSGMLPIPSWFQSYVGGKRLGVGFGPYLSVMSAGPVSFGPTLYAMDPINGATPNGELMSPLGLHELMAHQYGIYDRFPRGDGDYINIAYAASIDGPTYIFDDNDEARYAVWIDGTNKHGLIYFATLRDGKALATIQSSPAPTHTYCYVDSTFDLYVGDRIRVDSTYVTGGLYSMESPNITEIDGNRITFSPAMTGTPVVGGKVMTGRWYGPGGNLYTRNKNYTYIFDPDNLIGAAQGTTAPDALTATKSALLAPDGVGREIKGAAYDSTDNKLYVAFDADDGGTIMVRYSVDDSAPSQQGQRYRARINTTPP